MGVRGLLKLLRTRVPPEVVDLDEERTEDLRLLVDFQPFVFWLLGSFQDELDSWRFDLVAQRAEAFVRRLRRCGVEVVLVADGAVGAGGVEEMEAKLAEWKSRANQQLQEVKKMKEFLEGTGLRPDKIHRSGLFVWAVRRGLELAGARLSLADGEADPVLALELNDPKTLAILGNDTDFVLMKHGTFIHLDELDQAAWLGTEPEPEGRVALRAPVWTRPRLAAQLGVSEEVLPMAAALCGNDHSRELIDRCRKRGLPGPNGAALSDEFGALAKLLQSLTEGGASPEEAAFGLLKVALPHQEHFWEANQVLSNVQSFYAPQRAEWGSLRPQSGLRPPLASAVYKLVHENQLPSWCWPLASHGLFYTRRIFEDPGIGMSSVSRLLQLKKKAFSLLAPLAQEADAEDVDRAVRAKDLVAVRVLGASDSSMFEDKVKMFSKHEDLLQLHQWPTWRRLASLRQALSEAIPSSGVEATSTQEGGACSVRDLHWWALRFTATSTHLKLHQAEFDALAACSLLLMHRPAEPTRQGPGATRASWRCLCLGFWFQKVIADIYDLAMIMKVAPETAHPSRLFDGPTFWQLLQLYQCPASTAQSAASAAAGSARRARGKMGFRGSPSDVKSMGNSEEEFLKLRESSTFRAWRQEVLEGLAVALVKPELGTAPLRARRNESGAAPAPAAAAAGRPALKGLPIEQHKETLCQTLLQHRVTCVHGETGSGKSTQVPQYLLELFPDAQVAVTQPRRMAAINLAKRVAAERHEVLGQTVGYRIGGDSLVGSQLNFQTTGWLLRALVSDTNRLGRLTHVVFDEIHERSADADFLSLVARLLLHRFPQVNLVIMSATLQANLFRTYFRELQLNQAEVPVVEVGGRCYQVQNVFLDELKDLCGDELGNHNTQFIWRMMQKFQASDMATKKSQALAEYCSGCSNLIIGLLGFLAKSGCTILVFLPGLMEITSIFEECQSYLNAIDGTEANEEEEEKEVKNHFRKMKYKVFAMHSQIPMEDQLGVFQTPPSGVCHFVLASNVAESSLTLPNVCAVIDTGMHKQLVYDHRMRMTYLALKWTSKASAHQRSGRAGRTMEGIAVRLYPKSFYQALPEFDRPETASLPLPRLYLQAKQLAKDLSQAEADEASERSSLGGACSVLTGLVDPPDVSIIEASRRELAEGSALASEEEESLMTSVGKACLNLPFDLSLCRLVWLGVHFGCAADGVILACSLAVQDPFSTPTAFTTPDLADLATKLRRSNDSRRHFDQGMNSQPLALRELFKEFWRTLRANVKQSGRKAWQRHAWQMAGKHAVMPRRLVELVAQVDEVAQRLVPLVPKESRAAQQLTLLLKGLGRQVLGKLGVAQSNDDQNYDGPTIWDETEQREEPVEEWKVSSSGHIFEAEVSLLRALLVASFSDRLLTTRKSAKKNEKLQLSMAQLGADVKRSLLVAVPEALPTGTHPCKFFSLITGCPEANLTIHGALDDYYCIELQPPTSVEEKHDEVSSEESSGSSQVEKKEKKEKKNKMDNDKNKEKHDEVSSEERSGSSQVEKKEKKEKKNKMDNDQNKERKKEKKKDDDDSGEEKEKKEKRERKEKKESDKEQQEKKETKKERSEKKKKEKDLSDSTTASPSTDLMPCDIHQQLHIFNQLTRGKAACPLQIGCSDPTTSSEAEAKVQVTVKRPVHPCELVWEVHAAAEEDQKGRASTVRRGIMDAHSPMGFLCDVADVNQRKEWYACCNHVAYTEGSICFPSGLTVLHQQHLKMFLLTVDPLGANLALKRSRSGAVTHMQMHRRELPLDISVEQLRFVDRFRQALRAAMLHDDAALLESDLLPELRAFCREGETRDLTATTRTKPNPSRGSGKWVQVVRCDLPGAILPNLEPLGIVLERDVPGRDVCRFIHLDLLV